MTNLANIWYTRFTFPYPFYTTEELRVKGLAQGIVPRWRNRSWNPIIVMDTFEICCFFHCLSMWPVLLEAFACANPGMISVLILIFADTWADGLVLVSMRQSLLWSWSRFCSWSSNQAKFTTDIWSTTKPFWKTLLSMWVLCGSHVHVGSFMNNWLKELCLQKLNLVCKAEIWKPRL